MLMTLKYGVRTLLYILEKLRMTRAPEKIPATPHPAIALPPIRVELLGATPHIREPSSNTKIAARKAHLTWQSV